MSTDAPIPAALVRQRTSEALAEHLAERTSRQVGSVVGCDHSTVGRRGSDLSLWSAADLLTLAASDGTLRRAIAGALAPELVAGAAVLAEAEAREAVGEMGGQIAAIMARLGDARLDAMERATTAAELRGLSERMWRHAAAIEARA